MTRRVLTASRVAFTLTIVGMASFAACSSSTSDTGGSTDNSTGGGGNSSSKSTSKSSSSSGGSSNSSSSSSTGNKGGSSDSSSSSSSGSGGSSKSSSSSSSGKGGSSGSSSSSSKGSGGSSGTSSSSSTGSGGSSTSSSGSSGQSTDGGAVTCSNSDKSTLPIDSTGWVDKTCNSCGIQGAFYCYADENTGKTFKCGTATTECTTDADGKMGCHSTTPPWQSGSPGPGMCVSGTTTGSSDDWGAGIGLSLNVSGPGSSATKSSFDATDAICGNITGFDVELSGDTGDMHVRIGYSTSWDSTKQKSTTISPFNDHNGISGTTEVSGVTEAVIAKATIPTDWNSTDPSPPDAKKIYDLQFQVATDTADASKAFTLCVDKITPVIDGKSSTGTTVPSCKTGTAVGSVSDNLGVLTVGGFGMQNNVNGSGSGTQTVTGYAGSGCVAMDVATSGITNGGASGSAPRSYPAFVDGWHWGKQYGPYTSYKTVSSVSSAVSTFSFTPPTGDWWDVAYDMWVGQSTSPGDKPDGNTIEVMVWLDYSSGMTTNPIGDTSKNPVGSFTSAGTTWEVWYGTTGSPAWNVVSFRRGQNAAPVKDFDLAPFLKEAMNTKYYSGASTSWYLWGIEAGFELFKVDKGGSVDNYALTIK